MITPQRPGWEDKWFVYVESGFSGNLSSWSGDPGPQGWFKVEPWNININRAMDQISATCRELPAMPMLGSAASGYTGPENRGGGGQRTAQPQNLSEIRLEATYSECINLDHIHATQRAIILHVEQNTVFSQIVGRQHQESFFMGVMPNRDMLASLSRSLFELTLEPPSSCPVLRKLSNNMVKVGEQSLRKDETMMVTDGTRISLGAMDGQPPMLVLTMYVTSRCSGGGAALGATCAHVPAMNKSSPSRGGGGYSYMEQAPSPIAAPIMDHRSYMDTSHPSRRHASFDDDRPPTMPQYPRDGGGGSGGSAKAMLECVFSSGCGDLSRSTIPLVPEQDVAIGRLHQIGFFEKLLPDHDSLACISRKHLTARLHRGGHMVEIENVSRNTVTIDSRTLNQGDRGELREGSTLRFTAMDKTLLEFRLRSESQSRVPATRFT